METNSEEQNAKEYKDRILTNAAKVKERIEGVREILSDEEKAVDLFKSLTFGVLLQTFDLEFQGIYSTIAESLNIVRETQYVEKGKRFLEVTRNGSIDLIYKPRILEAPTITEMVYTMSTARYWIETRTFQEIAVYMSMSGKGVPAITPSVLYILAIIHIIRSKLYAEERVVQESSQIINRFNFKYKEDDAELEDFVGIKVPISNSYMPAAYQSVVDLYSSYLKELNQRRKVTKATSIVIENVTKFISEVGHIDTSKMVEDKYDSPVLRDFKLLLDETQEAEEQLVAISKEISKTIPFSYFLDLQRFAKFEDLLQTAEEKNNKLLIESLIDSLIKTLRSAPINFNIESLIEEFNNLPEFSRKKLVNTLVEKNKQRIFTLMNLVNIKKDLNSPEIEFNDKSALKIIKVNLSKEYRTMLDIYGNSGAEFEMILAEAKQLQRQNFHMQEVDDKLREYGAIMNQINDNFNKNRVAMENVNTEIVRLSGVVESSNIMMARELRQIAKEQSALLVKETAWVISNIEKEIVGVNKNSQMMAEFLESLLSNVKEVKSEMRVYGENMNLGLQRIEKGQEDLKNFFQNNTKESEERQISFMRNIDQERMKGMQNLQEFQLDNRIALNNDKIKFISDQNDNINELSTRFSFGNMKFREEIERLHQMIIGFPTNELTTHLQGILETLKTSYDSELLKQITHIGETLNQNKEHISRFSREFETYFAQSMALLTSKIDTNQVTKQLETFNKHIDTIMSTSLNSISERYNGQIENMYRRFNERTVQMMKEEENIDQERTRKSNEEIRKIRETNLSNEINEMKERMKTAIKEIDLPVEKIVDLSNKVDQLSAKIEAIGDLVSGASKSFGPSNMNELLSEFIQVAEESENRPFSLEEEISRVENPNDEKNLAVKTLTNFKQALLRIERKIDNLETEKESKHEKSYRPVQREKEYFEPQRLPIREKRSVFHNKSMDDVLRENYIYEMPEPSYRMNSEENVEDVYEHSLWLLAEFSMMAASLLNGKSDFGLEILKIIQENTKVPEKTIRDVQRLIAEDFYDLSAEIGEIIEDLISKHASRNSQLAMGAYKKGWGNGIELRSPELSEILARYSKK